MANTLSPAEENARQVLRSKMSVSWGTQYSKLKTNLRLASNRLKLLQKKKTEQAIKARCEIAEFLNSDKEDRARIRVESIIREDFVVEAYELLEMYCELLLARFGIIQQMKELDDGIAEAVSSLLWVAPRIGHEIAEFKVINDELTHKYGKQFAEAARMNQLPEPSRVSPKLIHKLSVSAPSKLLVEKYLITIAQSAGIDFTPDPKVMRDDDDEVARAERNLINFMNEEQIGWRGGGNNGGGGGGGGSFLSDVASGGDPTLANKAPTPTAAPYQSPTSKMMPPPEYAPPPPPQYPAATYPNPSATAPYPNSYPSANFAHQHPSPQTLPTDHHIYEVPPPNAGKPITPQPAMQHHDDNDYLLPKFPEPPQHVPAKTTSANGGGGSGGGEPDLDFDALARRFEELKKKL